MHYAPKRHGNLIINQYKASKVKKITSLIGKKIKI